MTQDRIENNEQPHFPKLEISYKVLKESAYWLQFIFFMFHVKRKFCPRKRKHTMSEYLRAKRERDAKNQISLTR